MEVSSGICCYTLAEVGLTKVGLARLKLFGMVALSLGMITKEQLDEAVVIQRASTVPRKLGAILLSRGILNESQVREILRVQGKTGETTSLPESKSERKRLLGDILVERGAIDRQTLTAVLRRQKLLRKTGISPRLGELLIAIGKITRNQLKEALVVQATA